MVHDDVESIPGERLAAWWLTLGRTPKQVVRDLVEKARFGEDEAHAAVDRARRARSMAAHPARSSASVAGTRRLRLVRPVL